MAQREGLVSGSSAFEGTETVDIMPQTAASGSTLSDQLSLMKPRETPTDPATPFNDFNMQLGGAFDTALAVWGYALTEEELRSYEPVVDHTQTKGKGQGKKSWTKWRREVALSVLDGVKVDSLLEEVLETIRQEDGQETPQGAQDKKGRILFGQRWLAPVEVGDIAQRGVTRSQEAAEHLSQLNGNFSGLYGRRSRLIDLYYIHSFNGGNTRAFDDGCNTVALGFGNTASLAGSLRRMDSDPRGNTTQIAFDTAVHPEKRRLMQTFLTKVGINPDGTPDKNSFVLRKPVMRRISEGLDTAVYSYTDMNRFPQTAESFTAGSYAMLYAVAAEDPEIRAKMEEIQAMNFEPIIRSAPREKVPTQDIATALTAGRMAIMVQFPQAFQLAAGLAETGQTLSSLPEERVGKIPDQIRGFSEAALRHLLQGGEGAVAQTAVLETGIGINASLIAILLAQRQLPAIATAIRSPDFQLVRHIWPALQTAADPAKRDFVRALYGEFDVLAPDFKGDELNKMLPRRSKLDFGRQEQIQAARLGNQITAVAFAAIRAAKDAETALRLQQAARWMPA